MFRTSLTSSPHVPFPLFRIIAEHSRLVQTAPKTSSYGPPIRTTPAPRARSPPLMPGRLTMPSAVRRPTSSRTPSPPPYHAWNTTQKISKVTDTQKSNMQIPAPYLMTFKNPTNSYFDEGARQLPRAIAPSDLRKRKRDELLQRAVTEGTFDFDERPIPPSRYDRPWRGGSERGAPCASERGALRASERGGNLNEVVDVLDVEEDSVVTMEIPIASVLNTATQLGEVTIVPSGPENQIVLLSDSDE